MGAAPWVVFAQNWWQLALEEYDERKGIDWQWQSHGRGDDEGAAGRGKKPGKTRRIVASWASSGRRSPTGRASRLPWPMDGANAHDQTLVR